MSWNWQTLDNDVMNIWQDGTGIHLQLFRWDDECYFNIDTPWVVPSLANLFEVQDGLLRAQWPAGKIEFERKSAMEFEEGFIQDERGGVEIYIVSNAKPVSNVMEFPISHQGLNFYYQPELTQEEIDAGAHRPEKVVGSYAIYHSIRGNIHSNQTDADKYKCGKAFHLYRPKITDNKNKSAWIDLNIDTQNNLMTLTIPQDFLDSAKYPVTIDPNFGYETQGTTGDVNVEDKIYGREFLNNQGSGTGDSISACLYINNQKLKCAIYDDVVDLANYIQTTDERADITEKAKAYYTFNFSSSPNITDNTGYLLCVWGDQTGGGGYGNFYYDTNDNLAICSTSLAYGDWPATVVTGLGTRLYSIYCTFTLGEAPAAYIPKVIGPF